MLEPNAASDSHPYPVELDLPTWTLARDVDLRRWLFGFGAGLRIEQPTALRLELLERCREVLAVHGEAVVGVGESRGTQGAAVVETAAQAQRLDQGVARAGGKREQPRQSRDQGDAKSSGQAERESASDEKTPRYFLNRWRRG